MRRGRELAPIIVNCSHIGFEGAGRNYLVATVGGSNRMFIHSSTKQIAGSDGMRGLHGNPTNRRLHLIASGDGHQASDRIYDDGHN